MDGLEGRPLLRTRERLVVHRQDMDEESVRTRADVVVADLQRARSRHVGDHRARIGVADEESLLHLFVGIRVDRIEAVEDFRRLLVGEVDDVLVEPGEKQAGEPAMRFLRDPAPEHGLPVVRAEHDLRAGLRADLPRDQLGVLPEVGIGHVRAPAGQVAVGVLRLDQGEEAAVADEEQRAAVPAAQARHLDRVEVRHHGIEGIGDKIGMQPAQQAAVTLVAAEHELPERHARTVVAQNIDADQLVGRRPLRGTAEFLRPGEFLQGDGK